MQRLKRGNIYIRMIDELAMGSGRSLVAQRYFLDGHSEIVRYLKTHFLLLSLLGICHGLNAADPKRPNITMILADDLGSRSIGLNPYFD